MKLVHVYRVSGYTDIVGRRVRQVRKRGDVLRIVDEDGTVTLIPWAMVSRVVIEKAANQ